jgi:long-subunit acyl-CoA synthetase (AMP-forming)
VAADRRYREIDDEGDLTIVDRQNDRLITAGGKHVAPQPVEDEVRRRPLVAEVVLIGDRCQFIAAPVAPDCPTLGNDRRAVSAGAAALSTRGAAR